MESTQPNNDRHEITIEEEHARETNPTHNMEDNTDESAEATSQELNSNIDNTNDTPTPTMESRPNTSTTTATPHMFKQALAEVPDPTSFLQTPTPVDDSDLS